jgi:hypothetical protein
MGLRGGMTGSANLVLLTNCTYYNEVVDKGGKPRPPEVLFDNGLDVGVSKVTSKRR